MKSKDLRVNLAKTRVLGNEETDRTISYYQGNDHAQYVEKENAMQTVDTQGIGGRLAQKVNFLCDG